MSTNTIVYVGVPNTDTTYPSLQAYANYKGVTWRAIPNIRKEVE